jgi:hypothetical protein
MARPFAAAAWKFINAKLRETDNKIIMALAPQKKSWRQPDWVAAILITGIIVWLHFFFAVRAGGLWRDEVNLVNLAGRHSLGDIAKDSFPVLMPLTVRVWMAAGLGRTDEGLRLLGAMIGLGLVAALWASAWMARRSPPLPGLVLMGLNSTVIAYGDSLRGYGLGSLLIVFTMAAACAFLRRSSLARAGWLALFAILSVQALYQNAVFVGVICLGGWVVCLRRRTWRAAMLILAAGLAAALSLLPYLPTLIAGRSSVEVLRTSLHFNYILDNLAVAAGFPFGLYAWVWGLLAILVIAGAVAALGCKMAAPIQLEDNLEAEETRMFAGTVLLAGSAGFTGFLWLVGLPTQPWYYVPLLALVAACFDAGLPSWPRLGRTVFFGSVAATALIAIPVARRDLSVCRFTNVDVLSRRIIAEGSPEDLVVVTPWYCGISFDRYFKSATPWATLPPLADHSVHRYDLVRTQMQNTNAIQPVLDQIAATLRSGRRVWVVSEAGLMGVPEPGTLSPYNLPPPPLPGFGWSGVPYTLEWVSQTAHFLSNHSRRFEPVKIPAPGDLHINENLDLFVASGWQDFSPTNSPATANPP